jgi:hypothetical protein
VSGRVGWGRESVWKCENVFVNLCVREKEREREKREREKRERRASVCV